MAPAHARRLLAEYGGDLAVKAYLFADPFSRPQSFRRGEYKVYDPSFDGRSVQELVQEFSWMRERVLQIRWALLGGGGLWVRGEVYVPPIETVFPKSVYRTILFA